MVAFGAHHVVLGVGFFIVGGLAAVGLGCGLDDFAFVVGRLGRSSNARNGLAVVAFGAFNFVAQFGDIGAGWVAR